MDDPYYKQKEALLDKLGDLKLEDITVDNKLGITTNVQAFVGHTTMLKDTVNIRDILGFGNISDNIKKQYEESKALIEKYNEGLNTYNEADYPSILPSFAKKLWYNLTKKKEKTIDNYDDYLDAIIESGDFNFATEGEKKLSMGLDFIPVLGIGKMALEGLLGEDLVTGRDLNALERILSAVPAGVGALAKIKNAIKLGEIGGKVEGSISFGINGGGQIDNIISKLKQSKAEEDMVAKEAVTIDKGGSNAEKAISKIDEIEVKFNYKSKYDEAEFARQLADQEAGMNKLTVDEFLKNRERFIEEGRAIEGNMAQQAARKEAQAQKIAELRKSGLSYSESKKQAEEWLKSQAALHNPDQIAGGNPLNIDSMGDSKINSSIGSQWKYRINAVYKQIKALADKMTEAERKSKYLNVKLKY